MFVRLWQFIGSSKWWRRSSRYSKWPRECEEYPEENDYINDWNIEKLSDDDVDNDSVDDDNGNKINILDNRGKVNKGKKKEEDFTIDDEELNEELLQQLNELKEKYKKK